MVSKLSFFNRPKQTPEFDPEEMKEKLKTVDFEKGDVFALIVAALITVIPTMLLIIGAMMGIIWLIFLRGS